MVHFVPVLFVVSAIAFTVTLLLPGDAALAMLGESNIHDKVAYEAMRAELGLDQPIPIQYAKWLGRALQGDLGRSIRTGEPVLEGLLAGYYGGRTDDVLMRLIDGFYAFPLLLLALAIAYSLGPGLNNTLLAIGIGFTPHFARLTRGQTLSVREREFVAAARVTGAPPWRIMVYHIWPNVTAAIIVQASLLVGQAIIPVWPEPASRPAVGPRHWPVYRPYPADGCAASPRSCRVPARSYRTGSRPL